MRTKQILVLALIIILASSEVTQITTPTFSTFFGQDLNDFKTSSSVLGRDWLILFYTPEIDESLDAREMIHSISEQYESRLISTFKKKGMTEYEQFEKAMNSYPQISEVDCGQNQQICEYFAVKGFPTLLYMAKTREVYAYSSYLNAQELFYFLTKAGNGHLDANMVHRHHVSSSFQLLRFLNSDTIMYIFVFLVLPFLYGYLCMAKNKVGDNSAGDKNSENKAIEKKSK